jgi:hypothetical protein
MVKLPAGITTISGQLSHSLNMSFGLSKASRAFDNGSDEDDDNEAVSAWFTDATTSNAIA